MDKTDKPLSTADFVAQALRKEIEDSTLLPGEPLLQDRLATRFGVSQGSVREAFRKLEADRLVNSVKNHGVLVSTFSAEQIEELYELRRVLEVHALTIGFAYLQARNIELAEKALAGDSGVPGFLGEQNREFHRALCAHPTRLEVFKMIAVLSGNLTRFWRLMLRIEPGTAATFDRQSAAEHVALLDACRRGDLDVAQTLLNNHIDGAKSLLVDFVKRLDIARLRSR